MAKAFETDQDIARIERSVLWTERQPRRDSRPPGRQPQILPQAQREFELAEELEANETADAYWVKYIGDGDSCTAADFEVDTTSTFKVGGGAMPEIREVTHAAGTRGHCRKQPGQNFWVIYQMGCQPRFL